MRNATIDIRFLLNRGYDKSRVIRFVGNKYLLKKSERHLLFRALYPKEEINKVQKKLVPFGKILDKHLVIDSYNVLIGVESILYEKTVVDCDDGVLRDISGVFGSHTITSVTHEAIDHILSQCAQYPPKLIQFFLDQQISKSGELSGIIREKMLEFHLNGNAETVKQVDTTLKTIACDIVATSDTIIIAHAPAVVDIPRRIVETVIPSANICKPP
jgi:hypothetical protein